MSDLHEYSAEFAGGYRATLRVSMSGMTLEWSPRTPQFTPEQAKAFLVGYRKWRNECLSDFARTTGINIAVID
jgi:hypothetical protein